MVKPYIHSFSYWLGIVSAVIALVMRTFNAFGVWLPGTVVQGMTIWYMSFYKAAFLFFAINIATAIDIWARVLLNQRANAKNANPVVTGGQTAGKFRTATAGN